MENNEIFERLVSGLEILEHAPIDTEDVKFLVDIYECKGDSESVMRYLFQGYPLKSSKGREVLYRLRALEDFDLIYIKQEPISEKIIRIFFHHDLKAKLIKTFPHLFVFESETSINLRLTLLKRFTKEYHSESDYYGAFQLEEDVVLKKGVLFEYMGWLNSDSSIQLNIIGDSYRFSTENTDVDDKTPNYDDAPF